MDFSGEDKASDVKFCNVVQGVLGRESPILEYFAPPEAQNRTNRRAATSIRDRHRCATSPMVVEERMKPVTWPHSFFNHHRTDSQHNG